MESDKFHTNGKMQFAWTGFVRHEPEIDDVILEMLIQDMLADDDVDVSQAQQMLNDIGIRT
jgi:hypothetical protein